MNILCTFRMSVSGYGTCSQDLTFNLLTIDSLEALGTNAYNRYAMFPAGHIAKRWLINIKDEDNSPKTLNDNNHQASSPKFRQPK